MISEFVREQKRYTQKELCSILKCHEDEVVILIRKLKEYGVLKAVKASDKQKNMDELLDEDIEISDVEVGENEYFYVFTFVGVIVIAGRVLKCYPKYLLSTKNPTNELKQVIKVLEKYNSTEQIIRMFNDSSESSYFNLLAVILFLLNDYYENGIYKSTEDVVEYNGTGEILWDKTINESFAILSNERPYYVELHTRKRVTNDFDYFTRLHQCILTKISEELKNANLLDLFENERPYYVELHTRKRVTNDFDYFTRLHQCILTKISEELKNANLLDLFEITEVDLSDEKLDDFGDEEYILYRIEKELNIQFNTRKQLILKTIYSYIDKKGSLYDVDCLSLFGTNSFNLVWEKICAHIMNNQLENSLGALNLPVPLKEGYDKKKKLIELIEKPLWTITGKEAKNTLIPDLVSIFQNDGNYEFIIFDAKYYNAHLENGISPSGQPGIESITKQYLYWKVELRQVDNQE